jgi:hypothetical protein
MEADRHDGDDGQGHATAGGSPPTASAFEYRIGKWIDNDLIEAVEECIDLFKESHDVRDPTEEEVEKIGADVVIDGKYYVIYWKMEEVKNEEDHSA